MNRTKKWLAMLIISIFVCPTIALAHPPITVYVDGAKVAFDQPPIIVDDRTLVPMRAIFKALGCEVVWSEETQSILSTRGNDVVLMQIGDNQLFKNGALQYTMPVPAQIVNDRTLVPIRAISEAFDAQVAWDGKEYVITILSQNVGIQDGGYSKEIKADDGTVVLTTRIDYTDISNTTIREALSTEAFALGEGFVRQYSQQALNAYAAAKQNNQPFVPYSCVGSYELTREDKKFLSFLGTTTQFTGGQNIRSAVSHTYSAQSGKSLVLSEIISDDTAELEYFWYVSFKAMIDAQPDKFYSDADTRLLKYIDKIGFYLTADGIAFYLPPSVIGPNDTGIISFAVQYLL